MRGVNQSWNLSARTRRRQTFIPDPIKTIKKRANRSNGKRPVGDAQPRWASPARLQKRTKKIVQRNGANDPHPSCQSPKRHLVSIQKNLKQVPVSSAQRLPGLHLGCERDEDQDHQRRNGKLNDHKTCQLDSTDRRQLEMHAEKFWEMINCAVRDVLSKLSHIDQLTGHFVLS